MTGLVAPAVARRNFQVLWASNCITAVGMMGFIPLIPLFLIDLGVVDPSEQRIWAGVLTAGAPLLAAFMGPFWGSLGDRLGRKPMILRANVAIVLFVGAMAFVDSVWELLALRLLQGVFSGYIAPAMTLVSVATPAERQARVLAWLQTAILCGASVGPLLGGWFLDDMGIRSVFLICAGMSATATLLVALLVREERLPSETAGGLSSPLKLLRDVGRDVRTSLASRALASVLICVFAVRFGSSLVEPILALFVMTLQGYEPETVGLTTGLLFGGQAFAALLATPLWGRIGDRFGYRKTLAFCAGGGALCFLGQAFAGSIGPLLALRFLSGAMLGGIVPSAFAAASRHSSASRRGGAYGVTFSSVILARALGLLAGGWLAAVVGLVPLFVIAALFMGGAMLLALRRSEPPAPRPAD
jgi:DHA1 family multidrug resistance protein-like MFS transporter